MATLTIERSSCSPGCPLHEGCFALHGPLALVWRDVKTPWEVAMTRIERLPMRTTIRVGQAGDLPGEGDVIDRDDLFRLIHVSRRLERLIYTHKPVLGVSPVAVRNREIIAEAAASGCVINLSGNNPAHADQLADLGIAPVTTLVLHEYARRAKPLGNWTESIAEWRDRIAGLPTHTPAGRRLAVCPATYTDTTCLQCKACMYPRDAIIAFPAHGRWRVAEREAGLS